MGESATALIISPPHEIEAEEKYLALKNKCQEILKEVQGLQIRSQPTMDDAAGKKTSIKLLLKQVGKVKDEYVKPINDRKGEILNLFKAISEPLGEADQILDRKMGAYQEELEEKERKRQEEERRRQEEERKRAEQEALEAQKKLEEAETPQEIKVATKQAVEAEQKIEKTYDRPKPTAKFAPKIRRTAGGGSVSFRTIWEFEIVDASQVPREYLAPDMKKIRKVVDAGVRNIAGVRIWSRKGTHTRTGKI